MVHTCLVRRWPRLRSHRCEQPYFLTLLSELRFDEGTDDCDWRCTFAFHSAHEDRGLRITRRAKCRIGSRRHVCGTGRHCCDLRDTPMARQFQRDMVPSSRHSADVNKRVVVVVAEPRTLVLTREFYLRRPRPNRARHRCLSFSSTISKPMPAASVNARSSACNGQNRNSVLAVGQTRLNPKIATTAKRIHLSAGLGRRNAATGDVLNERLTRMRLTIVSTSAKNVSARTSSSGMPRW